MCRWDNKPNSIQFNSNCGFINVRWSFNFVDFEVGPNHEINAHELPKIKPFFLLKFKIHEFKCPQTAVYSETTKFNALEM